MEDEIMKKMWEAPALEDLTISATAHTSLNGFWWIPGNHNKPNQPNKPGRPGHGGMGGGEMSPSEFHPEESLS